jgi:hypothetical protein
LRSTVLFERLGETEDHVENPFFFVHGKDFTDFGGTFQKVMRLIEEHGSVPKLWH